MTDSIKQVLERYRGLELAERTETTDLLHDMATCLYAIEKALPVWKPVAGIVNERANILYQIWLEPAGRTRPPQKSWSCRLAWWDGADFRHQWAVDHYPKPVQKRITHYALLTVPQPKEQP